MDESTEHTASEDAAWQARLQELAGQLRYPPTPDVSAHVRAVIVSRVRNRTRRLVRQLAWAALIVIVLLSVFAAVPELRAAVLEALRIGAVRIFPSDEPAPTGTPGVAATATALYSILDLPGETTLDMAEQQLGFHIQLPQYPPDLGAPDRVFLQDERPPHLTLVWLQDDDQEFVRFSLSVVDSSGFVDKYYPWREQVTEVNGDTAIWLTGVHVLYQESQSSDAPAPLARRIVQKNVLIWEAEELTYRLESDLSLEEARRVAESVRWAARP